MKFSHLNISSRVRHLFGSFLLAFIYTVPSSALFGQDIKEVTVNLGGATMTGVPFDVPFVIKSKVDENVRYIKMQYKIASEDWKKWMRYPKKAKGSWSDAILWKHVPQQEFSVLSGAIHPNVVYVYQFTIYNKTNLDALKETKFKQDVMVILEEVLKDLDNTEAKRKEAEKKLNTTMQNLFPPGVEIVDTALQPFTLHLYDYPISILTDQVIEINLQKMVDSTLHSNIASIFKSAEYAAFQTTFQKIAQTDNALDSPGQQLLKTEVDNENPSFGDITMNELIQLFAAKPNGPSDILLGKATINNGVFKEVTKPDLDAIALLGRFYFNLDADIYFASGALLFTAADRLALKNIMTPLVPKAIRIHTTNNSLASKREKIIKNFENILEDKLLGYQITTSVAAYSDVVSEKNPYIGLDFGFSYMPTYEQLFFYQGANFYFAPINKDAPLSSFRTASAREWLSKRLSIHLGLTQSLIEVENDRYLPLLEGIKSSMLAGLGLRINRIIRFNFGYMFFYEKDNNPTIDKKHFTVLPQFSLTADINVGRALGGVAKSLGIIQ